MRHFWCIAFLVASVANAQVAATANSNYQTKEGREGLAKALGDPQRDERQRPQELVDSLKLRPGATVSDIGTGVGYLLPFLSKAVGSRGKVIAEDIFPDFLNKARQRAAKAELGNVEFMLGDEKSPHLPENAVDVVLILDAYHHFDFPESMLANMRQALKAGGRLVVVDYYKRPEAMNGRAPEHIRLDDSGVIKEIQANGFRLLEEREHIPKEQYVAIFTRN